MRRSIAATHQPLNKFVILVGQTRHIKVRRTFELRNPVIGPTILQRLNDRSGRVRVDNCVRRTNKCPDSGLAEGGYIFRRILN